MPAASTNPGELRLDLLPTAARFTCHVVWFTLGVLSARFLVSR